MGAGSPGNHLYTAAFQIAIETPVFWLLARFFVSPACCHGTGAGSLTGVRDCQSPTSDRRVGTVRSATLEVVAIDFREVVYGRVQGGAEAEPAACPVECLAPLLLGCMYGALARPIAPQSPIVVSLRRPPFVSE